MTILITGGTGKTGGRVADRLTTLGHSVRALTRHSEPRFDWHDDSTWDAALSGCTSAYLTFQPDLALVQAIHAHKQRSGRAFPTWSEVLRILRELGYEKTR